MLSFLQRLRPYLGAFLTVIVLIAAWRAVTLPRWTAGDVARQGDWETARPGDCRLMAQAVLAYDKRHGRATLPLLSQGAGPGPCDWPRAGLALERVTQAQFAAATAGALHNTGYIPHRVLGRPRYSLFHLRASVGVGRNRDWLDGSGDDCQFWQTPLGWRLQQCREAWIS
jgi:hypothetical protein